MDVKKLTVGPLQCNCYVVSDSSTKKATIIDPGGDAADIINFCDSEDLHPTYLIATHAHADHIGALPDIKDHFSDAQVCVGEKEIHIFNDSVCNLTKMVGLDIDLPEPDKLLSEGDELNCGDITFSVLHTPGHTPGAISLVADGEEDVVFCGDVIFQGGVGRVDLPGGDRDALRASIEDKILPMPDDTVLSPGHGQRTSVGQEREATRHL